MGVVVDSAMNPTSANTTQSSVLRNLIRFGGTGSIMTDKKAAKANQVLPDKPTIAQLKLELRRNIDSKHTQFISFGEAFGAFGIPMLFTLVVSFVWTVWLTFLALAPNYAANLLMDTSSYDNGQFWHINDTYPHITIAAVVGLVVVDICYIFVALRMLFWRDKLLASANSTTLSALFASTRNVHWRLALFIPKYKRIRILWNELTSFEGANRKKWNACLKLIDLLIEATMLRQLLLIGSPAVLTYGYASFLAINSLSCVVNVLMDRFSALTEVFIDSIFDLCAAILFPIATLIYCYYNFDFDREVYLTYLEKLPPGSFEHLARTFADPSEIALFRVTFDSLRASSMLDFALRVSMNLTFCYRFERVLETLVWMRCREHLPRRGKKLLPFNLKITSQNPVPKATVIVFVVISVVVLLLTHKSISESSALCSVHPECVVYAHWLQTKNEHCPCLVMIDVDPAPKTYTEWIHPIDAYDKVKMLAASGRLTSLQIINRKLLEWPEELRKCHNLKTIQLLYTSTERIPGWAKELKNLETIQIEGKCDSQNLYDLPDDLFHDLPRLSLINFGLHPNLQHIPPFIGVPNLQSLNLAYILQLRDLPSFNHVPRLSRLVLTILPRMEQIPDLSPLKRLNEFVIYRPNRVCCNGFVGPCELNHPSCRPVPMMQLPRATCLRNSTSPNADVTPFMGNSVTKEVFNRFSSTICQESAFDRTTFSTFPTKETVEMCDGKLFRQCQVLNSTGLCYNTRFQVLACLPDPNYIALRRLQIEKGVGPPCNPSEEKWLGCSK